MVCGPATLSLVSPAKKTYIVLFIGRWNREETCEIRKFENAIWESNLDTMGYVWMDRWKYRKHKMFLCFNGGPCFIYLNQSEQADCCRNKSYHCFRPNGEIKLELYTLSADEIFVVKNLHVSKGLFVDIDCLKVGHYVAAVYEGQWHPSLIFEIN